MKVVLIVEIYLIIVFIVFFILFHHLHEGLLFEKKRKEKTNFYFYFSRLKPLDIECMKALHHKVNIVPIIAKADALTPEELVQMKQNVCRNKFEIIFIDKIHLDS